MSENSAFKLPPPTKTVSHDISGLFKQFIPLTVFKKNLAEVNDMKENKKKLNSAFKKNLISISLLTGMLLLLLLKIASANVANDNVVISQAMYEPYQNVGEAVELYNPTNIELNISGWVLATEASSRDAVIPQGTIIKPQGFYLITDTNWSNTKYNSSWPESDYEETITLANADSGIALKDANNLTIDAIGWGNPTLIQAGLFEGSPFNTNLTAQGRSIQRNIFANLLDTDNNSADFYLDVPNLRNSNSTINNTYQNNSNTEYPTDSILVSFTIANSKPMVFAEILDENRFLPGIQINPIPGATKTVNFSAVVADENGAEDIVNLTFKIKNQTFTFQRDETINTTAKKFFCVFEMNFYDKADNYTLELNVQDRTESTSINSTFKYMPAIGIQTDSQELNFTAVPGKFNIIPGDKNFSTKNSITMQNIGNVNFDVIVLSSNFSDSTGANRLQNNLLNYTFESANFNSILAGNAGNAELKKLNLTYGTESLNEMTLGLYLPAGMKNERYSATLSILAVTNS